MGKKAGWIRRLYDLIVRTADKPFGVILLCVLAFTEASFLPVSPFMVLLAFCLARPKRSLYFALLTLIFTVLGGIFGYYIGQFLFEYVAKPLLNFYGYWDYFTKLKSILQQHEFLSLLIAGMVPIPFKVFSILSGSMDLNFFLFILAAAISRGIKYFLFAILFLIFGEKAQHFAEKNLTAVMLIFGAVLIGLIFVIRLLKW